MKTTLELILEAMILEGWDEEWGGDVDAPTGCYSRLSVEASDLPDVMLSFGDLVEDAEEGFTLDALIGYWLYRKDSMGIPYPERYETEQQAIHRYEELEESYERWYDEDELYV
ncbi:hypothetical protein [Rhodococcus phage RGL3]|uniref:Uncharacterized protein n=1 Tax=Rhodococcus phage RGL3 TaxID=2922221 RepID=G9FHP3_9CAUD|nr:hypothetical protein RoPhRGL3_gp51 [Rhodococcus phage RGL3]AEV52131.1 hypothetical protein [Rhodococcus phage RGL3]